MFCPQCGHSCPETVDACALCGHSLAEARQRLRSSPPPAADPARAPTVGFTAIPPSPPAAPSNRPRMGTMLGVAVPAPGSHAPSEPPPATPAPHRPSSPPPRRGTLMGLALPGSLPHAPQLAAEAELQPFLRRVLERSYRPPAETVAETIGRHGLAALTDRHHLEQELWAEYARDVRLILCALDDGIPGRIFEKGDQVRPDDLARFAQELAQSRGLAEEAAEYAVVVWAAALRRLWR